MIDWTAYFDRIWCINYIPYKDRRYAIEKEFDRIGISSHPNFNWNFTIDSPLFDIGFKVLSANPNCGHVMNPTELKCWCGNYSCIKKSCMFGDDRILIIEDDSRFLNDVSKIKDILDNIPEESDITLFDHFTNVSNEEYESYRNDKVNDYFSRYENLNSTGCYSLSKKAIKQLSERYEHYIVPADYYTSKMKLDGIIKTFSIKNLSCQCTYRNSMSFNNAGKDTIHRVYAKSNIIYSEYNMNNGEKYDYGSFVIEEHT